MFVLNMCRVDYKYRLSSLSPIITKTALSNMVSTQIIKEKIKVVKFVDREKAGLFNLLKYTIVIYNISDEKVNNLFFKDKVPKGTSFVINSLTINNIKKRCINPELGFYINKINSKEIIKITFKVIITSIQNQYIKNISDIEYDYLYNIEEDPIKLVKKSNIIKTKCIDNLFKQVLIKNKINSVSGIDYITKVKLIPKITKIKLINSYIEEQCGLLIIGKINCFVFCKYNGKNYIIEDVLGFSRCMAAPLGLTYINKIDMKITTEYTCSKLIDKNTIFINTALLIHF